MSWDIFVQDLPKNVSKIEDIPDNFEPQPLGSRSEVIKKILEVVPTADFTDPSWGIIDGDGWSIEISMGSEEECTGFAFHVRGANEAVGAVAAILEHLKLRALDPQNGEFFSVGPEALSSFENWRNYRDRVLRDKSSDES